jgi:ABC-2 type transport system ATP-binding protein
VSETNAGTAPAPQWSVVAEKLTKVYGKKSAVDGVDLAVAPGEFFGILGPNGAGKSTTIKMFCGLVRPTSGRAIVLGHDVRDEPLAVKAKIGVMPEEVNTYERLTARELLVFTGRLHGLARKEAEERTSQLLTLVEIGDDDARKMIVDYSMGMRKKTVLAAALIHGPRVLFLDEPFNGIDAVTTQALRGVLQKLTARGVTIFFSSHVLEVVEKLCTRIAIIHQGRLQVAGTLAEIREKTGHGPDVPLQDVFVQVVGGNTERGELSWT